MKKYHFITIFLISILFNPFSCTSVPGNSEQKGSAAGDTTPPVITINYPTNYQEIGTGFSIGGQVSDDSSGVDKVFVKYSTNNYIEAALSNDLWYSNISANSPGGTNTNYIYAVDKAGNASTPVLMLLNRQPIPFVAVTNNLYGQNISNEAWQSKGICQVDNPYVINNVYLFVIANNATNSYPTSSSPPDWKVWADLQPNTNWLIASAVANNGRSNFSAPMLIIRDVDRPVPGNSGEFSISDVHETKFYASWQKAADNYTPQGSLQYRMLSVRATDNLTNTPLGWSVDTSEFQVETGLSAGLTYSIVLSAKDGVGNISNYKVTNITTPDETPPLPANSGAITMVGASETGLIITWDRATDNVTTKGSIQYKVVLSLSGNVNTPANAEGFGTTAINWTTFGSDAVTNTLTGLSGSTTYYVNVITKDLAGNKQVYTMNNGTTLNADGPRPAPGNNGNITWSLNGGHVWIYWTKATDVNTPQAGLLYKAYKSLFNNIDTVANILANGTGLCTWQYDLHSMYDGDAPANFTYYNVLVKDASGNLSNYTSMMYYNP